MKIDSSRAPCKCLAVYKAVCAGVRPVFPAQLNIILGERQSFSNKRRKRRKTDVSIVCYTAVFSVVTQRTSPQTAAENRTTFLSRG